MTVPTSEGHLSNHDHKQAGGAGGLQQGVARSHNRTSHLDLSFPRAEGERQYFF